MISYTLSHGKTEEKGEGEMGSTGRIVRFQQGNFNALFFEEAHFLS